MEQFLADLNKLLWLLAPTAIIALCGLIGSKASKFFEEHAANNQVAAEHGALKEDVTNIKETVDALCDGVRLIIKDKMVENHEKYVHQKYATPAQKDHFEEMHSTYKSLRGNGTGDSMYEDVMQMYSIAPNDFKEE